MSPKRPRRLQDQVRTPRRQPRTTILIVLVLLGLAPVFEATTEKAGAASPEITYASVDYSIIDSGNPSIAEVRLLGVGSPASEFHRTAFGGVRGVVDGVELPAPAQSSTVVRSFAWSGSNGVAVGSTIDSDGVVRSALWLTAGHGWKLVVHRFPTICSHCIEVRPEFQFVMYSAGFASFVVASSGGLLSLVSANGLAQLDTTTPARHQIAQCEVNNVVEDSQALWVLGSCAPEARSRRYPAVTRTRFRDRKSIEMAAFGAYEPAEFGLGVIDTTVVAFENEPEKPGNYRYRTVDPRDSEQSKPWSHVTRVLSKDPTARLLRIPMFRLEARKRSDASWTEDNFHLLVNAMPGEPLSFVRSDDVMHAPSLTALPLGSSENGREQTMAFRGHRIVVRNIQFGTQVRVDNTIENETSSEFDNDQQTFIANRELAAVVVTGGESSVGSWSGWRTVGITFDGTSWTWRDSQASTMTTATCIQHQTLGIVSPNEFTVIDARTPDRWHSWARYDAFFTGCGFAGPLRVIAGYQERNGFAFPIVFVAKDGERFVPLRLVTPGVPTGVFLRSGKVCLSLARSVRPVRNVLGPTYLEAHWQDAPGPIDTVCLRQALP
jgi:hypothetical protein